METEKKHWAVENADLIGIMVVVLLLLFKVLYLTIS